MDATLFQTTPKTPTAHYMKNQTGLINHQANAITKLIKTFNDLSSQQQQQQQQQQHKSVDLEIDLRIDDTTTLTTDKDENYFNDDENTQIKIQLFYCGLIMVIYISESIGIIEFFKLIRSICKFDVEQQFTIKWIDEEGDACTITSQHELDEAVRLYDLNKESELHIHIFPNVPERIGQSVKRDSGVRIPHRPISYNSIDFSGRLGYSCLVPIPIPIPVQPSSNGIRASISLTCPVSISSLQFLNDSQRNR